MQPDPCQVVRVAGHRCVLERVAEHLPDRRRRHVIVVIGLQSPNFEEQVLLIRAGLHLLEVRERLAVGHQETARVFQPVDQAVTVVVFHFEAVDDGRPGETIVGRHVSAAEADGDLFAVLRIVGPSYRRVDRVRVPATIGIAARGAVKGVKREILPGGTDRTRVANADELGRVLRPARHDLGHLRVGNACRLKKSSNGLAHPGARKFDEQPVVHDDAAQRFGFVGINVDDEQARTAAQGDRVPAVHLRQPDFVARQIVLAEVVRIHQPFPCRDAILVKLRGQVVQNVGLEHADRIRTGAATRRKARCC